MSRKRAFHPHIKQIDAHYSVGGVAIDSGPSVSGGSAQTRGHSSCACPAEVKDGPLEVTLQGAHRRVLQSV